MQDLEKIVQSMIISGPIGEQIGFLPLNEEDMETIDVSVPELLPILTLRNAVLFPSIILPITVGREKSIKLVREVYAGSKLLGAVGQKDAKVEDPAVDDIFKIGTLARILKIFEMPDGGVTVLLHGLRRFEINRIVDEEPYFKASTKTLSDKKPAASDKDYNAMIGSIKDLVGQIIKSSQQFPPEAAFAIRNIENNSFLVNYVAAHIEFNDIDQRQKLLEIGDLKKRALKLIELLQTELQMLEIKNDIQQKVRAEMDQQQREYFLHQQIKTIQNELGDGQVDGEVRRLEEKAEDMEWPESVRKIFEKELRKFEKMNPGGGDFSVQLNYLDTLIDLPWNKYTDDNLDLTHAKQILEEDHFGLDEIKERILEYLAVIKLKGDLKSPIICLYGPPGVGKTSLGKSVARALDRNFGRVSLGGMHDEAEIRGHRRTYIGAMPGRIIQTINRCKSSNPVIVLDEVDKVGSDFRGDPSSALLEVLDPEQNSTFRDNYLDVDYDLSKVMFITTANRPDTIHPALRDRMEMIHISGYVTEEKMEIAKRHLIPKELEIHGVSPKKAAFDDKAIETIIDNYTRESGVRSLDKHIAKVVRNRAKAVASNEKTKKKITADDVRKILGAPKVQKDLMEESMVGVTTGLAWTEYGGEILFVEASLSQGKGLLTITGNLGDVMKESATIAQQYIKANAEHLKINPEEFEKTNLHIHVPEGAIPKDGPSAGITMMTSMISVYTGRKVKKGIAMTGEVTLRGRILPVGGIKEKILAAKRAGITELILCKENQKDVEEIKSEYLNGLNFKYVSSMIEIQDLVLEKPGK